MPFSTSTVPLRTLNLAPSEASTLSFRMAGMLVASNRRWYGVSSTISEGSVSFESPAPGTRHPGASPNTIVNDEVAPLRLTAPRRA